MINSDEKSRLIAAYSTVSYAPESGMSAGEIADTCRRIAAEKHKSHRRRKAEMIAFLLRNARLSVNGDTYFVDGIEGGNVIRYEIRGLWERELSREAFPDLLATTAPAYSCGAYHGDADYGHVCPDWGRVMRLGIPGILDELKRGSGEFYECSSLVWEAFLDCIRRFIKALSVIEGKCAKETAAAMIGLTEHPPRTLHEGLELICLVFRVMEYVEGENCRSLGLLDQLLTPLYEKEGKPEAKARELLDHFLLRLYAIGNPNGTPFSLGGQDRSGCDVVSEMTELILEEHISLDIHDPKIHIRLNPETPQRMIDTVLRSIRDGKSSFVFVNDEIAIPSLEKIGISTEDARDYLLIGCYEPAAAGTEIPWTCSGKLCLSKAVEVALNDGCDLLTGIRIGRPTGTLFSTFEDFLTAVKEQICYFAEMSMSRIRAWESIVGKINPSPFLSATYEYCVAGGKDIYEGGAKYNNSSVVAFSLASAVDALAAIQRLVYDEKRLTLDAFVSILKKDWEGEERLRLHCNKKMPKYGNNDPLTDGLAKELNDCAHRQIAGKPNARGGVFRYGNFSVDWRHHFGERSAASADGRRAKAPFSKNLAASIGCDRKGVSALMRTVLCLDHTNMAGGDVLDIVLHSSMVDGKEGLRGFANILRTYFEGGGFAVHFNVLNPETLRRAQKHPEEYATLQVRLCGWNVVFVNLSESEQNEFILQSEASR